MSFILIQFFYTNFAIFYSIYNMENISYYTFWKRRDF